MGISLKVISFDPNCQFAPILEMQTVVEITRKKPLGSVLPEAVALHCSVCPVVCRAAPS